MSATRLLRWLACLALFLAPLGMIGAGPAMAHSGAAATGHCAGPEKPAKAPASGSIDCMIACAGLPAQAGGAPAMRPPLAAGPEPLPLALSLHGLHPEAAIPPPRSR